MTETAVPRPVRHEAKWAVLERHVPPLLACLDHFCARDPRFPVNIVSSLYFDTPRMDLLNEKEQSEYLKCKVRVRWYRVPGGELSSSAWLEVKKKEGARSEKYRVPLRVDVAALDARPLEAARTMSLLAWAEPLGQAEVRSLRPACVIRYTRERFIDMGSGQRIALDHAIRSTDIHAELLPGRRPVSSAYAVLEVKGPGARSLPADLHVLERFGLRRTSFSKYAECLRTD